MKQKGGGQPTEEYWISRMKIKITSNIVITRLIQEQIHQLLCQRKQGDNWCFIALLQNCNFPFPESVKGNLSKMFHD